MSVKKLFLRRRLGFAILGAYLLLSCPAMAGPTALSGRSGTAVASFESPISKMEKIDNKQFAVGVVDVNADLEKIWDVLADYDNAPLVFDNLKLCQCVGKKGNTKFVRQVVEPGAALKFDYTVALVEEKPKSMVWQRTSGSLKEVYGKWLLEPLEPVGKAPRTRVTYRIFLDGGLFLPSWILTGKAKNYIPTMLSALKQNVEGKAKP